MIRFLYGFGTERRGFPRVCGDDPFVLKTPVTIILNQLEDSAFSVFRLIANFGINTALTWLGRTTMRKILPIVVSLTLGMACSMPKRHNPNLLKSEIPYIPEAVPTGPLSEGSLWEDRSMVSDMRASHLNDLVTIRIMESTNAISQANVTTSRDGSNSYTLPGVAAPTNFANPQATATSNAYKGNGTTGRSAVFTTMITARVVKVLHNGNLIFEGCRDIQLNNETQRLYVAGVIDPRRLDKDNSIVSGQVADLRIGYGGAGVVDETLKPGYVSRVLNFIWPF